MSAPSTVLFDLDDTLCVSTQDPDDLLAATFDAVGVDPYCAPADLAAVVDDVGVCESDVEFYASLFDLAAERVDAGGVPARELARAHDDCVDHSAVRFREGAESALAHARETADRVGLVTNGGEATQTTKLDALGLVDAFDAAVFAEPTAGVDPKPDPAPFEHALARLDADPAETVHVGDSLRSDVAGANGVGIDSVWVPREADAPADGHEPTHRLDSLAGFPSLF